MRHHCLIAAAALAFIAATPVAARTETFRGALGGTKPPAMTGSPAAAQAQVKVDRARHRVSLDLRVTGITLDRLDPALKGQPAGPVQFRQFRNADDIEIAMGVPFGASYQATKDGFRVILRDYDYDAGKKPVGSFLSFDEFATAMRAGQIVLDIHTARFPDGEISGRIS